MIIIHNKITRNTQIILIIIIKWQLEGKVVRISRLIIYLEGMNSQIITNKTNRNNNSNNSNNRNNSSSNNSKKGKMFKKLP